MPQKKKEDKYIYLILYAIVFIFVIMLSLHAASVMERERVGYLDGILGGLTQFSESPFGFLPISMAYLSQTLSINLLIYFLAGAAIWFEIEKDSTRLKKDEKGSGKWYTDMKKYNQKYTDPYGKKEHDGPGNMILTNDVFLGMNTRKTLRNNNILVIGGSGSGKSRFFVKPNILQANCSYVITDPSGELLVSQGKFLEDNGYKVKVFNLVDMEHSNCYNPFNYIRDDLGVLMLVNCLIKNTTPPGKGGGDPFWEKSETALLQALIFYLIKYRPKEERNFTSVMKLLRAAEVDENNPSTKSPLDRLFDQVERTDPDSIALKSYRTFKMGAGKTLKSILISCAVRLTVFNMKEIENLTGTDDIDLGRLGDEKQALFVVIPAADDTYNFLVSMMYSQLFETLYYHAENECPKGYYITENNMRIKFVETEKEADDYIREHPGLEKTKGKKALALHCRFMLDEFANIGQIPEFDKKLATMRKYEISCSIILQNLAQIKEMYDKKAEGLIGNCDTILFLGSSELETCKYISEKLGKGTVVIRNNSRSRGAKGSSSLSYNRDARDLMSPDEVARMDNSECIVFIRGLQPFKTKKYDYPKHPNYKYTGDNKDDYLYDYESKFNNQRNDLKNRIPNMTEKEPEINIEKSSPMSEAREGIIKQQEDIIKKANENQNETFKSSVKNTQTLAVEKENPKTKETEVKEVKPASEIKPKIPTMESRPKRTSTKPQNSRNSNKPKRQKPKNTSDEDKEEWMF